MKKYVRSVIIALMCVISLNLNLNAQIPIVGSSGGSTGGGIITTADDQLVIETVATLAPFRSVPAYKSWAIRQVNQIQLDFRSESMVDSIGYGWGWGYNESVPSVEGMADVVASAEVSFRIVKPAIVTAKVSYVDGRSDWRPLFEGTSSFYPWQDEKTGGWIIPPGFGPVVGIPEFIKTKLPGISQLQVVRDEYGSPSSQDYIYPDGQGYFNIPRNVIGNTGTWVATPSGSNNDKDKFAFRINDGQPVQLKYLTGPVRPTMDGVESLLNPAKIDIKPESRNGVGHDLLKEVTYTTNVGVVVVTAVTSEGEIADTVTVVDLTTGSSADYAVNPKGLEVSPRSIKLTFKVGHRYHVYANWFNFQDESAQYGCPPGYDCYGGPGKGSVEAPVQ